MINAIYHSMLFKAQVLYPEEILTGLDNALTLETPSLYSRLNKHILWQSCIRLSSLNNNTLKICLLLAPELLL